MATHRDFVEPEVREFMNNVAHALKEAIPEGYGFTLLVFGMDTDKGFMNYISSAAREDMIAALKELIGNFEGRTMDPPRSKQ